MTARAVVFDLDDTLADTAGTVLAAAERRAIEVLVAAGLRTDADAAFRALRDLRDGDPGAPFLERLVARYGADDPARCLARGRAAFFASDPERIRAVPDAPAVLAELRRRLVPLYLVTFGVPDAQQRKIDVLGIRRFFVEVHVLPLSSGADKTDALRGIRDRIGGSPRDVWVVGDRPPGEIRAGNRLGLTTVRVRSGEFASLEPAGPEEEADHTISRLRELLPLL